MRGSQDIQTEARKPKGIVDPISVKSTVPKEYTDTQELILCTFFRCRILDRATTNPAAVLYPRMDLVLQHFASFVAALELFGSNLKGAVDPNPSVPLWQPFQGPSREFLSDFVCIYGKMPRAFSTQTDCMSVLISNVSLMAVEFSYLCCTQGEEGHDQEGVQPQ